ncbi:MAG: hypothetical protein EBU23_16345 [Mycobacteriaceae bacterium]|nr:hypothetical protein [Mycobacteriaceae bacterium]
MDTLPFRNCSILCQFHYRECSAAGHCIPMGNQPVVRAQFEFEFKDGRRLVTAADGDWKYAASPILKDSHWIGECYDARREPTGWDQPGFKQENWKPCLPIPCPTKRLAPDLVPPERVVRRVKAKKLSSPTNDVWLYDMGESFSGAAEIAVSDPAAFTALVEVARAALPADVNAPSGEAA